jgi:SAM-dependent methyltransferase
MHSRDLKKLVTCNGMGRTTAEPTEVGWMFVNHVRATSGVALDIGCAYGVTSIPALEAGGSVFAVDIEKNHLEVLEMRCPDSVRSRLTLQQSRFPSETEYESEFFDAVHAANLFNFLSGVELELGIKRIFGWLKRGGKLFSISGTPYARNIRDFIPEYERRRASGSRWPGVVDCIQDYSDDPTVLELPARMNFLDDVVLSRTASEVGFQVEICELFHRSNTPSHIALDGRENVVLVARKS